MGPADRSAISLENAITKIVVSRFRRLWFS